MRTFVLFIVLIPAWTSAQQINVDTSHHVAHVSKWRSFKVPAILIGAGLVATTDNEVFDKWEVYELRNNIAPHFHTHLDDYMQFAPAAAVFALDAVGLKGQNTVINQAALLVKSELLVGVTVFGLKKISSADRPGTEIESSFPSGHTTEAFAVATFLHREYGKTYPLVSVLGYTAAAGVGILRIINNKHWLSDVLVGAGIGTLSTTIVYQTHQFKWGRTSTKNSARISPLYQRGAVGFSLNIAMS